MYALNYSSIIHHCKAYKKTFTTMYNNTHVLLFLFKIKLSFYYCYLTKLYWLFYDYFLL